MKSACALFLALISVSAMADGVRATAVTCDDMQFGHLRSFPSAAEVEGKTGDGMFMLTYEGVSLAGTKVFLKDAVYSFNTEDESLELDTRNCPSQRAKVTHKFEGGVSYTEKCVCADVILP